MISGAKMLPTSVGVVLPCKNEVGTIARCLTALRTQVPAPDRIVVVDNGSTDGSLEIARELADIVLEVGSGRISGLRNKGAAAAGDVDVLAFVDSDVEVAPGWLAAALRGLKSAELVGSRMLAAPDDTWVARRWAALENSQSHDASHVWSGHLAMSRSYFGKVGGFNEALTTGEDSDLSQRVRAAGGTVLLVPDMVAVHHGFPSSLKVMLRRERWHAGTPGWFPRMSRKSQALVVLSAIWALLGSVAVTTGLARRRSGAPLAWLLASAAAVPSLGAVGGGSPRNAMQDGVLLSLWAGVRAVQLPRELSAVRRRSSVDE